VFKAFIPEHQLAQKEDKKALEAKPVETVAEIKVKEALSTDKDANMDVIRPSTALTTDQLNEPKKQHVEPLPVVQAPVVPSQAA